MFRRMRTGRRMACCLCFIWLLCCQQPSAAQSPPPYRPPAEVTRQTLFSIPFYLNPHSPAPSEVHLYVSGDGGNTWTLYQRRQPHQGRFDFQAGKDGEYCFAVRTSDDREVPAGAAAIEKIVIVDRVTPELDIRLRIGDAGQLVAEYRAADPNLDPLSLRLTYRTNDSEPWQPVPLSPNGTATDRPDSIGGQTSWAVAASTDAIQVQAEIADRAGNRRQWQDTLPSTLNARIVDPPPPSEAAGDDWATTTPFPSTSLPERFSSDAAPRVPADPPAISPEPTTDWPPPLPDSPSTRPFPSDWPTTTAPGPGASVAQPQQPPVGLETSSQLPAAPGPVESSSQRHVDRPNLPEAAPLPWLEDVTSPPTSQEIPGWRSTASPATPAAPLASTAPSSPSSSAPLPPPVAGAQPPAAPSTHADAFPPTPSSTNWPWPSAGRDTGARPTAESARPAASEALANTPSTSPPPESMSSAPHAPTTEGMAYTGPPRDRYSPPVANRVLVDEPPPGVVVQMTNSRRFNLDYDVSGSGPQPVARVELWISNNRGNTWQPYGIDADLRSPFLVELDDEGIYGFRMLIHNQDGSSARPPQPGDAPDLWIGLDWTPPQAELISVEVSDESPLPKVHIRWRAEDAHFDLAPIRLSYAPTLQGPWSVIEEGLANTGSYTWTPPHRLPGRTFLQLEATDRAGNVTTIHSSQPIGAASGGPQGILRGVRPANAAGNRPPNGVTR